MKKYLVFLLLFLGITNVSAYEISTDSDQNYTYFDNYKETLCQSSKKFGTIKFRNNEIINNNIINYYCEFDDPAAALATLKDQYKDALNYLKDFYHLEELDSQNWNSYYVASQKDGNTKFYNEYLNIRSFFDTYENTDKNNQINDLIASDDNSLEKLKNLDMLIPDYNKKLVNDAYEITPFATQIFNVSAGVSYAERYAWNPNSGQYGDVGADCTNFASQILENGGYNQVWGLTNRLGWWYKNNNGSFSYSWSWVNADKFLKYLGIKNYYYDFEQFSRNVQVGDFIVLDENDDGDYNHAGFVTYKANSLSTHTINGNVILNYYDFIVAQHTNNYNSWVSEDNNGWENGVLTNTRYAIVNINK